MARKHLERWAPTTIMLSTLLLTFALAGVPAETAEPTLRPVYGVSNPLISERDFSEGWGWYGAWTANSQSRPQHDNAYFEELDSGIRTKLNRPGTEGAVGNFHGDWLVYTERPTGGPGNLFMVGQDGWPFVRFPAKVNTPADEFRPTIFGSWLLFTRYNASTDTFRVMLFNRRTKGLRTLASASGAGAVYADQVRGDYATWHSWGPNQSNVFRYRISTRSTLKIPKPAQFSRQHDSAVGADGAVYYQRRIGKGCGSSPELVMYPLGGSPRVLSTYPAGKDGGRVVLDPPAVGPYLNVTVITCGVPASRATDAYWVTVPANPSS